MKTEFQLFFYSPRWGHEDGYDITLNTDYLEVKLNAMIARATIEANENVKWQGEDLLNIMSNDHIYPPAITPDLFIHVWKEWRAKNISDNETEKHLKEISKWVNESSRNKPSSKFWYLYF